MADNAVAPASPIKTFLLHIFSWHALLLAFGQAVTITGLLPSLAQWHTLLLAIGEVITALGAIKASLFKTPYEKAAVKAACASAPVTAGSIIAEQSARVFLPIAFLALAMSMAACPAPAPIPTNLDGGVGDASTNLQVFDTALAQCEESSNISAVTGPQAQQLLQILMAGGLSWAAIEKDLESVAAIGGGDELAILGGCVTYAYLQAFPIAGKPTPSQAAARIYLAKQRQRTPGLHAGHR
jgi:hypothetical protein